MDTPLYRPPNTFYRVSLKAVIRDPQGRILVVKENESDWSLPGGGWDHGEAEHAALARELFEEVGYDGAFTARIFATETFWLAHRQSWLMWLVYEVTIDNIQAAAFSVGQDADEIAWMYPREFESSTTDSGRWIYKNLA